MNKFVILLSGVFVFTSLNVNAQQYVRKQVQPDFFIPTNELNKQEKLPSFPAIESGAIKVSNGRVMVKTYQETDEEETEKQPVVQEILTPLIIKKPVVAFALPEEEPVKTKREPIIETEYSQQDGLGDELSKDELYLAKEQAYEKDLQVLSQTGDLPRNEQLESDLKKMSDSLSFRVE